MADTSKTETAPVDEWEEHSATWEDQEAVRLYSQHAFESLQTRLKVENIKLSKTTKVLDFGCGTGLLTQQVAPMVGKVVSVDPCKGMIKVLREKNIPNVETVDIALTQSVIDSNPLFKEHFDVILASSVLAFVDDHAAMVKLLSSILKPGGIFVHWDWELIPTDEEPFGIAQDAAAAALKDAGLERTQVGIGFEAKLETEDMTMKPIMASGVRSAGK
jgi:2-polyprenyl-3-methyl-5-hydroxy-6-metoxy-1,4-benzoquinol methylase